MVQLPSPLFGRLDRLPRGGNRAVGGLLATLLTYLVGSVVVGLALAAYTVFAAPPGYFGSPVEPVLLYVLILAVAVLDTGWVAIPAGSLAGLLYERSDASGG